jgi:hypothetical protein
MRPAFLFCAVRIRKDQRRKWETSQKKSERPRLRTRQVTIGK